MSAGDGGRGASAGEVDGACACAAVLSTVPRTATNSLLVVQVMMVGVRPGLGVVPAST
jgi:hypothetical protein